MGRNAPCGACWRLEDEQQECSREAMRYLSVCSGIEAASVAWHPLGWEAVGFSEIEKFPSAVLAHHYPNVPNFGDMTKHETWPLAPGSIDLLVGGTPCQSFSVAGLRKGLADPRGNLMLTYLAIADRLRPRWIVWENVPGVLSSNGGRDFGTFLGALGELGYGWAYRVLDAQWCRSNGHPRAVSQRRRRVFVIGSLGGSRSAAEVLFERESVFRDTSTRRKTGQSIAESLEASLDTVGAICAGTVGETLQDACTGRMIPAPAPVVIDRAAFNQGYGALYPPRIEESETMSALVAKGPHAVATQAVSIQENGFGTVTFSDVSNPLTCGGGKPGQGYTAVMIPEQTPTPKAVGTVALRSATADSEDVFQTLITERACGSCVALQDQVQAVGVDLYNNTITGDVHVPLRTAGGHGAPACMVPSTPYVVRRLTPRECERLQGFPDDWTAIPFRGKPAADGPRYKALGNSMAVNCMEWIGERIAAYEERKSA